LNPALEPLLSLRRVSRVYGRLRALYKVTLDIYPGEAIALFGANGAGKTTLLRVAATLLTPSEGEILYRGKALDGNSRSTYRHAVGLVGHASFLYDELSARENLLLHARLRRVPEAEKRTDDLLERVGLSQRQNDRVSHFSRGMEQRLSLARALVSRPDLLLLDEPFTGLDKPGTELLCQVLHDHRAAGGTTVLISHDLALGLSLADRYLLLSRGELHTVADAGPWRHVPAHEIGLDGLMAEHP